MSTAVFLLCLFSAGAMLASAEFYKVGDSAGWNIGTNYTVWATNKTFQLGDTMVFYYDKQYHNVLQVSKADFRACNASAPIATYTSGHDSVLIERKGHYYFICGFPGHCSIGQKVDIRIPKTGTAPSPSPTPAPAPAPKASHAPKTIKEVALALAIIGSAAVSSLIMA